MATYVGVDACKTGWFAVILSSTDVFSALSWNFAIYPHISTLWAAHKDADIIMIDIPIGLPDDTERACDIEARRMLKDRASSVFTTPVRDAVYADSYAQASEFNLQKTDKRISRQVWNITPKIREVDSLVRHDTDARRILYEAHPELVFKGLGGHEMTQAKTTRGGIAERLRLLENYLSVTHEIYHQARQTFNRNDLDKDDIVDAVALAVAARLGNLCSVPPKPEMDFYGIPMQIVYSQPPGVTRLHHVTITVPADQEANARDFYCNILGMREIPKPDVLKSRGGFWLELGRVQVHIGLEDGVDRTATRAHIAYQVIDLDHWRGVLKEAGIEMPEIIQIPGYDRLEFRDPFGNRIEFIQPLRR